MTRIALPLILAVCCLTIAATAADENNDMRIGATDSSVAIKNFQFTPKNITIKAGDTVTWTNSEGTHTVTADDNSWESPTLTAGKTFSHQFTKPGTYRYHCSFHGSPSGDMSGSVKVTR